MSTRSLLLTAVLLFGIAACTIPVAAENAWFEIQSNPASANVCLDHVNCQTTPYTYSVDPNSYHTVTVFKDGYQVSTQTIYSSGAGVTTPIMVSLLQNSQHFGVLDIISTPSDAGVWIDQSYYGKTPQVIGSLSEGTHSVTLKKAGYYDFTQSVSIYAAQTTQSNFALVGYPAQSGYGSLQIDSTPGGAAIYLNNNYRGTTLANGEVFDINQVTPGTYVVKLTLQNYQDYLATYDVRDGGVYSIHAVMGYSTPGPTQSVNGDMNVRSNPAGANIYLDNTYRGLTPLTLTGIPSGSHTIILKMSGYQDWQSSVNVPAGNIIDVSGTLSSNPTPVPTTYPSQLAPLPTQSPISLVSIISAIGICCAAAILFRINKKE